ncbi:uncharacterized protein LOC5501632 isoform X1 [Nematostella vectensis]|uniref:uncharacterized protein LOC5501632 isoform X1 n=1 Tax=Nematostella vectensis TaxID=45351 RepID=UPI002076ECB8|nr:uncharacterized protein LOC5501632 isoform X1 [Nematostella vectensis]
MSALNITKKIRSIWISFMIVTIALQSCEGELSSVTRHTLRSDTFEIAKTSNESCILDSCGYYGGIQRLLTSATEPLPVNPCLCECVSPLSTLYSKTSKCTRDEAILADKDVRCNVSFKDVPNGTLKTLDLSVRQSLLLDYSESCESIEDVQWSFYSNLAWVNSTERVFRIRERKRGNGRRRNVKVRLQVSLQVQNSPTIYVSGLLIKVTFSCVKKNQNTEKYCLVFKAKGTYNFPLTKSTKSQPATIPVSTTKFPTEAQTTEYLQPTKTSLSSTAPPHPTVYRLPSTESINNFTDTAILPTTKSRKPAAGYHSDKSGIWIAVTAGVVAVLLILVSGIILYCLIRRHKKNSRKGGGRREQSPAGNIPMHEYEYVQYPALARQNAPQTHYDYADCNVASGPMYERGPGNKLIIRTPGQSMSSLNRSNTSMDESSHGEVKPSAPAWIESYNKHKQASRSTLDSNELYEGRDPEQISPPRGEYQELINDGATNGAGYTPLRESKKDKGGYQALLRPSEEIDPSGYVHMPSVKRPHPPPNTRDISASYEDMERPERPHPDGGSEYITSPKKGGVGGSDYITVLPDSPKGEGDADSSPAPKSPDYFVLEGPDSASC